MFNEKSALWVREIWLYSQQLDIPLNSHRGLTHIPAISMQAIFLVEYSYIVLGTKTGLGVGMGGDLYGAGFGRGRSGGVIHRRRD